MGRTDYNSNAHKKHMLFVRLHRKHTYNKITNTPYLHHTSEYKIEFTKRFHFHWELWSDTLVESGILNTKQIGDHSI